IVPTAVLGAAWYFGFFNDSKSDEKKDPTAQVAPAEGGLDKAVKKAGEELVPPVEEGAEVKPVEEGAEVKPVEEGGKPEDEPIVLVPEDEPVVGKTPKPERKPGAIVVAPVVEDGGKPVVGEAPKPADKPVGEGFADVGEGAKPAGEERTAGADAPVYDPDIVGLAGLSRIHSVLSQYRDVLKQVQESGKIGMAEDSKLAELVAYAKLFRTGMGDFNPSKEHREYVDDFIAEMSDLRDYFAVSRRGF
ncbi:unnamed protein product, partial [marine sediment metagenome]